MGETLNINSNLIIIGGVFLFIVIVFQVASGLKFINIGFKYHKLGGIILLAITIVHMIIGLNLILGG